MDGMTIKDQCLAYRRKHVMSQQQLADKCGVHVNTIIHAEQGKPLRWMSEERISRVIKSEGE